MKEFIDENIRIRETLESDLDFIVGAESEHETVKYILTWSKEQHLASLSDKDILHLIVERDIDNKKLGFIILAGLGNNDNNIEFKRIVVSEKGKGIGRKSIRLIKKIAFQELKAERIWLDVVEYNIRARNLYKREGFREIKLLENVKLNEKLVNLIIMSISRNEFLNM